MENDFKKRIETYLGRERNVKNFISFLYRNKCYSKFMFEFAHVSDMWQHEYHQEECKHVHNLIENAFHWTKTRQGHEYWADLSFNWADRKL